MTINAYTKRQVVPAAHHIKEMEPGCETTIKGYPLGWQELSITGNVDDPINVIEYLQSQGFVSADEFERALVIESMKDAFMAHGDRTSLEFGTDELFNRMADAVLENLREEGE